MVHAKAPRLLDIEPRDHGKSVRWSCAFPLWLALTNPHDRGIEELTGGGFRYSPHQQEIIAQISYGGSLAERWIRRHKLELTYNKSLIEDWGEQSTQGLPDGKWTANEIILKNGAIIFSKGTGSQVRGDHPTQIIVDDLEDREESKNPNLREKVKEYFFSDLYGALEPDSRLVVVGTMVHPESLLNELWKRDIEAPPGLEGGEFTEDWIKFRYQAIKPDGSALCPEIWPIEALLIKRKMLIDRGLKRLWLSEYMNAPEISENPVFPSTWFQEQHNHYDPGSDQFQGKILSTLKKISFVDPNVGQKESNDWTAIVTLGYKLGAVTPEIYVLEVQQFRASFRQKVTKAINTWVKWRGRIGFESIAFQSLIAEEFGEQCAEKHYSPDYYTTIYKDRPIEGKNAPKPKALDKQSRAERVQEFFEMNWIKFNYRDDKQISLMDELQQFPDGAHDDQVDAIVGCLWEIKREWVRAEAEQNKSVHIQYDPDSGQPSYIFEDRQTDLPEME